ncbi:MAG TPA: hypothetical protein VGF52_06700 [Tepidisphaeraceae bacterium]
MNKTIAAAPAAGENFSWYHVVLMPAFDLQRLFQTCVDEFATDVCLIGGLTPMIRLPDGIRQLDVPALENNDLLPLLDDILTSAARQEYEATGRTYLDYVYRNEHWFRISVYRTSATPVVFLSLISPTRTKLA